MGTVELLLLLAVIGLVPLAGIAVGVWILIPVLNWLIEQDKKARESDRWRRRDDW